jgi:hypothetical protein
MNANNVRFFLFLPSRFCLQRTIRPLLSLSRAMEEDIGESLLPILFAK